VGDNPLAVAAADGAIWVANQFSHSVSKLQASTGATIGMYSVGDAPAHIYIENGNVWVANFGSHTLTKLRASDGASLGTFSSTTP
jgi:DNA-binding beta-propeller fold protein YncE